MASPVHGTYVRVLNGHVLDPGAGSKYELVGDLIRQAEPRSEVAVGGRANSQPAVGTLGHSVEFERPAIVAADARIRKGGVEAGELAPVLLEGHLHVPANAEVQGQLRQNLPIVLEVYGVIGLPLFQGKARSRSNEVWQAKVEVGQMKSARTVCVLGLTPEIPFRHSEQVGSGRSDSQAPREASLIMPIDAPELPLVAELDRVPALVPESAVGPVRNYFRLFVRGWIRADRNPEARRPCQLNPRTLVAGHPGKAELA